MSANRSQWGALSIQDRIRAMNDTLDHVEEAVEPNHSLDLSEDPTTTSSTLYQASTSSLPSNGVPSTTFSQDTAEEEPQPQKRSSVVDIWRQREGGNGGSAPKSIASSTKKLGKPWNGDSTLETNPTSSMSTTPSSEAKHIEGEDEKKEEQTEISSTSVRDMWKQRATPQKIAASYLSPTKPKDSSKKSAFQNKPKVLTTDLTIVPSKSGDSPSPSKTSPDILMQLPSVKSVSTPSATQESPSQRGSVLDFWKTRTTSPAKTEKKVVEPHSSTWTQNEGPSGHRGMEDSESSKEGQFQGEGGPSESEKISEFKSPSVHELTNNGSNGVVNRWKQRLDGDNSQAPATERGPISGFKSPSQQSPKPSPGIANRWKPQQQQQSKKEPVMPLNESDEDSPSKNPFNRWRELDKAVNPSPKPRMVVKKSWQPKKPEEEPSNAEESVNLTLQNSTAEGQKHSPQPGIARQNVKGQGTPRKEEMTNPASDRSRNEQPQQLPGGADTPVNPWKNQLRLSPNVPRGSASPGRLVGRWNQNSSTQTDSEHGPLNVKSMSPGRSGVTNNRASSNPTALTMPTLDTVTGSADTTPKAQGSTGHARTPSVGSVGELAPRRSPMVPLAKLPSPAKVGHSKKSDSSKPSRQNHTRVHSPGSFGEVALKPYRPPAHVKPLSGQVESGLKVAGNKQKGSPARSASPSNRSASPFVSRITQSWSRGATPTKTRDSELPKSAKNEGAPLMFSTSSAFNAYGTVESEKLGNCADRPPAPAESDVSKRKKKNLVSLGRRHIVKGTKRTAGSPSPSITDSDFEPGSDISSTVGSNASETASHEKQTTLSSEGVSENGSTPEVKPPSGSTQILPSPRDSAKRSPDKDVRKTPALSIQTERTTVPQPEWEDFPPIDMELSLSLSVDSGTPGYLASPSEMVAKNKKQLQEKRRRIKKGKDHDDDFSLPSPKDGWRNTSKTRRSPRTEGTLSNNMSGKDWVDELQPIDENESARSDDPVKRPGQQSEYTTLQENHSGSGWQHKSPHGIASHTSPRSDDGRSEVSCFSDSAFSGISRNSSNVSNSSSLANRAERLLQARRKKNRPPSTDQEKHMAQKLTRNVLERNEDNSRGSRRKAENDAIFGSHSAGDHVHSNTPLSLGRAEQRRREAGLTTRYNTSSRFIDNEISASNSAPVTFEVSVEDTVSVDDSASSSYRTLETASTGSDSFQPSERSKSRAKERRSRRSRTFAATVPAQFLDQSSDNMESFTKAFESLGISQIAADLAREVSNATVDITKLAKGVNDSVQSFRSDGPPVECKSVQCDALFVEEDVAIEVEYVEEPRSDDPEADFGGHCALIDDAVADDEDVLPMWSTATESELVTGTTGTNGTADELFSTGDFASQKDDEFGNMHQASTSHDFGRGKDAIFSDDMFSSDIEIAMSPVG